MSRKYTLQSTAMHGGRTTVSGADSTLNSYVVADAQGCWVGYDAGANNTKWRATNILFDANMLSFLRGKTVTGISLRLTATGGRLISQNYNYYRIGYKLNSTPYTENAGTAWRISDADSAQAANAVIKWLNSGSPSAQNITEETDLTVDLSIGKVPKYGYVIGSVDNNTATILYLKNNATLTVVTSDSLTLTYNLNGGSSGPAAQTKDGNPNATFTISNTIPVRSGFFFDGWKRGNTILHGGDTITLTDNETIVAQWSPASSVISSVTDSVPITGDASTGKLTVNITRYNASYTHDVKITLGTRTTTLTGQGTTAEFVIPVSWLDQIPEATSMVATVEVTTKSGSTVIGVVSSETFTATVPASVVPSVTFTSTDVNTNSTIDGWDVLVQGYSKIKLDAVATAGAGSSIKSITFSGDNVSLSGLDTTVTSDILTITGDRTWQVVVTDKRNRSTTETLTRTVYPYAVPAIGGLQAIRCDSSGNESPNDGTYASANAVFSLSDVGGNNTLTSKKIYYKIHTASSWTEGVSDAISGAWNTFGGGNILLVYVYDIKVEITDAVGNTATAFAEVNSVVGFAVGLKNDRARFGGPVQQQGLQVDWDSEFLSDVEIQGDLTVGGSIPNGQGDLATTGTIVTDGNPSSVTVSTGTWTTISSITLTPGIWLVYATSRFASNATGYRRHILTGSDSDTSSNAIQMDDTRVAVDGAYTFCRSLNHYTLTGNKTYYLRAYQNSGTSLGTVGRLYAIKII